MANALYDHGRQSFLEGGVAWLTDTVKAVLVQVVGAGTPYSVNLGTDQFLSDVPAGARIATSAALTAKTSTAGVANAANIVFAAVTGNPADAVVLYKDTGVAGTSLLIAYIDTALNLPVTPNGGDITIQWDTGVNKIFKL